MPSPTHRIDPIMGHSDRLQVAPSSHVGCNKPWSVDPTFLLATPNLFAAGLRIEDWGLFHLMHRRVTQTVRSNYMRVSSARQDELLLFRKPRRRGALHETRQLQIPGMSAADMYRECQELPRCLSLPVSGEQGIETRQPAELVREYINNNHIKYIEQWLLFGAGIEHRQHCLKQLQHLSRAVAMQHWW